LITSNQPGINIKSQPHQQLQVLHIMIRMNMAMIFIAVGFRGIYASTQKAIMGQGVIEG